MKSRISKDGHTLRLVNVAVFLLVTYLLQVQGTSSRCKKLKFLIFTIQISKIHKRRSPVLILQQLKQGYQAADLNKILPQNKRFLTQIFNCQLVIWLREELVCVGVNIILKTRLTWISLMVNLIQRNQNKDVQKIFGS